MTEDQNAPPAGGGEALTLDAAAAQMTALSQREQEQPAQTESQETVQPAETEAQADAPETTESPAQEAESEEQVYDLDKLHGNTKVRLRDGTEWTAAELKRRIGELQELPRRQQEYTEKFQKLQADTAQFAQQQQFVQQTLPMLVQIAQQSMPPEPTRPDPKLASSDPFAWAEAEAQYQEQKANYEKRLSDLHQLQHAHHTALQQSQQEQARRVQVYMAEQRAKAAELIPDLRDPVKAREFQSDVLKYGQETYGFTPQELSAIQDARLLPVVKDAIAYRKMMAAKPKVVQDKTKNAVPVQQPGRRPSPSESKKVEVDQLLQRASQRGGRMQDVLAAFNAATKGS